MKVIMEKYLNAEDINHVQYDLFSDPTYNDRKVIVEIDKWDTWNMDETLAHIIVPMLKQLKETKNGAPLVSDSDVPEHLRRGPNWDYDTDEKWFEGWDYVLDEMIFSFSSKLEYWEDKFLDETGMINFRSEEMTKYQERINNGFILFGKYYNALWD